MQKLKLSRSQDDVSIDCIRYWTNKWIDNVMLELYAQYEKLENLQGQQYMHEVKLYQGQIWEFAQHPVAQE